MIIFYCDNCGGEIGRRTDILQIPISDEPFQLHYEILDQRECTRHLCLPCLRYAIDRAKVLLPVNTARIGDDDDEY